MNFNLRILRIGLPQVLCALVVLAQPHTAPDVGRSRVLYADSTLRTIKQTQALHLTVQGAATYDSVAHRYTYSYTVTNELTSPGALNEFVLKRVPRPLSMASPTHWGGGCPWLGDSTAAGWIVVDSDTGLPPNDTGNIYPSPFNLPPGGTVSGFSLVSDKPPTTISFFAQAFDTLESGDYDVGPPSVLEEGVTGTIVGPDITSVVGVGGPGKGGPRVEFRLPQPNPALGLVSLIFVLRDGAEVKLGVHDVSGRSIRLLVSGWRGAGVHSITWNGLDNSGRKVRPGVYFYELLLDGVPVGERRVVILQ